MQATLLRKICFSLAAGGILGLAGMVEAASYHVYVGAYTGPRSKGIHYFKFNAATGQLSEGALAAEVTNPTWLVVHPTRQFLYALSEVGGAQGGGITAYAVEAASGKLTRLNTQFSGGSGPCHLAVDRSGQCLLVANYGGGSVAALPIQKDGSLGAAASFIQHQGSSVNPQRQKGPHAHSVDVDPGNRFVLVCDLGLDKVLTYRLEPARASLTPAEPPHVATAPGAGPRHLAFHPNGRWVYVINELNNTVAQYEYNPENGALTALSALPTLPADFTGQNTTAEIAVHPNGKFVYGSNRGHDSIVVYAVDAATGRLTLVQHHPSGGKTPRHFALDPTGRWMLSGNQTSGNLVVLAVNPDTGRLSDTGQNVEVPAVCVQFIPAP
ncbi:lactonase family protein [Fontisphaera persica]|uniref:lactonase family protein n=1 Tax=Fontisphaera persica TaxID=2974023 RepID=UPI0024BF3963|nr:lactonase family protein [Fontisphaera persica]WCJ59088.1 lactonase family protein [Fontisphaera persica]